MDIQRARPIRIRRIAYGIGAAIVIALATVVLSFFESPAPTVEKENLWIGKVERGPLLRQVRGNGTLVPVEVNWIPAVTDARVARIVTQAGSAVQPDTVIMELAEPAQVQRELDAKFQLVAAEADYASLHSRLEGQHLEQEAVAARLKAEFEQAKLRADADADLARLAILPELTRRLSRNASDELENRYKLETQRLRFNRDAIRTQLAAQKARVDQYRAQYALQQNQLASLRVRAGIAGVLQRIDVEVGQKVVSGTILAKVVQPARLKAELRIAETQARDILHNQRAVIDTRNGLVEGHVMRIDPAAQNGTVTVDVALDGALPKGARPDLTVDGTIVLEQLRDVLFVQRPSQSVEAQSGTVFRLDAAQKTAKSIRVKFGRSSVTAIEIIAGLKQGDRIILSDTSQWNDYERIRLE